jgi:large subunit ribosomal protein L18
MINKKIRKEATAKRHYKLRKNLYGTAERPRLAVYCSGKHIYAQLIDDEAGKTIVSASTVEKNFKEKQKSGANVEAATEIGKLVAQRAKDQKVETVVFDRGGRLYHGRVAALASAARETGLFF